MDDAVVRLKRRTQDLQAFADADVQVAFTIERRQRGADVGGEVDLGEIAVATERGHHDLFEVGDTGWSAEDVSARLGPQPPASEWGLMIAEGRDFLTQAQRVCLAPGLWLSGWLCSVERVGDGCRERTEPDLQ